MCFIHIDIFTQSLWLMNKHQLQNKSENKEKSVGRQCTKQMKSGVSSLPIPFKPYMETVNSQSVLRVNKFSRTQNRFES